MDHERNPLDDLASRMQSYKVAINGLPIHTPPTEHDLRAVEAVYRRLPHVMSVDVQWHPELGEMRVTIVPKPQPTIIRIVVAPPALTSPPSDLGSHNV